MASQLHQRLVELSRDEGLHRLIADQDENGHADYISRDSLAGKHWDNPADEGYAAAQLQQPALFETQSQVLGRTRAHSAFATRSRRPSVRGASAPALNNVLGGLRMSGDPESLEQFIADDWERYQHAAEVEAYLRQREEQRELESMRNGVVLRPTDNAVAARLASLMTMGQTLSPYTRTFQHTTMRSDVNQRYGPGIISPTGSRQLGVAGSDSMRFASEDDQYGMLTSPPPPQPEFLHRASSHGSRHPSISTFAPSSTPYTATTPPLSAGGRSPFPRNRTLRRKVHKISLSASKAAATD
ncbi:hypothetical protein EC988_006152 [Linderina pennispora]|nr:hypothetical protein EC988_006152 [Linderina pennispora]